MDAWAILGPAGWVLGLVLVIVAWTKREETWAGKLFWVGVLLLVLPVAWAVVEGVRQGITDAMR